ncbi:MAG: hypothetical protein ACI4QT_05665, partial [Kiritimatiellia bacterium]
PVSQGGVKGKLFTEQHTSSDSTGRSTGAQLVKKLPATGRIYISCLGQIGSTASTCLSAGQAYAIGLTETDNRETTASVAQLTADKGFYFGFGRISDGSPLPFVQAGGIRVALADTLTTGASCFFLARIDIGAGADGKSVIRVQYSPSSSFDGVIEWGEPFEADLSPDAFKYLKVGGAFATKGDTAFFDEIIVADTLQEVSGLSEDAYFIAYPASNIETSSATIQTFLANYSSDLEGASLTLQYGRDKDNLDQSVTVATLPVAETVTTTITGLDAGFDYYYRWRAERDGQVLVEDILYSFETIGKPQAKTFTLTQKINTVVADIVLDSPVYDNLTVVLQYGHDAENLQTATTFTGVSAGQSLSATIENLDWGTDYIFRLTASCVTEVGTVEMNPVDQNIFIEGTATFIAETPAPWNDTASWDIATIPDYTLSIDALFNTRSDVLQTSSVALSAGQIDVEAPVTFDLAGSTLQAETLQAGVTAEGAVLAVSNTVFALNTNDPGASAPITAGVYLGAKKNTKIYFGKGTTGELGSIFMASGTDNSGRSITIADGANVSANTRIFLQNDAADFLLDNATLTASGIFRIGVTKSGSGFRFTVDNNALLDASATEIYVGTGNSAQLLISGGATVKATSVKVGAVNDSGAYNSVVVSNANLEVSKDIYLAPDSRYHSNRLEVYETEPGATRVTVDGNLNVAAEGNGYAAGGTAWTNVLHVSGGRIDVSKALQVGGKWEKNKGNQVRLTGANAMIHAANMWMTNSSILTFILPEKGYAETPIQVDGNCRLYGDTLLKIDVSDFKLARQQLISAANMNGELLEADRIMIVPESRATTVKLLQEEGGMTLINSLSTIITVF